MHRVPDPAPTAPPIAFDEFLAVDIRVGTVVEVRPILNAAGAVMLAGPDRRVADGARLF